METGHCSAAAQFTASLCPPGKMRLWDSTVRRRVKAKTDSTPSVQAEVLTHNTPRINQPIRVYFLVYI